MEIKTDYNFIKKIGEISEDGIAVYDLSQNKFVYINANFLAIFETPGKPDLLLSDSTVVLKFVLSEDLDYLKSRFAELQNTGCINTTEFRLNFSNNNLKHISCDVMILENSNLVAAFVKDISKAKRHEDYLIKYTAQKDIMLDMLTHNLSGPLLISKEVINSLQKGYNENNLSDVSKTLGIIQENTQQCIDIVNDFLREEHDESSRTYVKKTRFDLLEKINVTLDKLRAMNADKVFTLNATHDNLNINSDPVKFFQIIHNILSNSIKYTRASGLISIFVKESGTDYIICIQDNGTGISDKLKPLMFTERMAGMPGLKGEKSSGLGLSIAKKLVVLLAGEIWFDSEEGKGSSFYIRLPKE